MSVNPQYYINKLLNANTGNAEKQNTIRQKMNEMYGTGKSAYNPFLDKNGNLFNKYIDYQKVLDNPNVSAKAKEFISQATGLTPAVAAAAPVNTYDNVASSAPASTSKAPTSGVSASNSNGRQSTISNSGDRNIVNSAKKYIGTPYVWGGESMSEGGMDCSGFVYNALKDAGYKVGRTTAQGYRSYGSTVKKSDMQPGDLVFYGSGNKATHIGIYIGDGQIIQSSGGKSNTKSNPGQGVSIKEVDYRNDFLEARRY